ncbi:hypothetical protein C2845_PM01G04390 [Panicum miliaceum]|uniref:3-dehydroquinate synthase C-terminal domain-containing protein n=1 Tax=Panicum miliaceum TaxID=4540 RepID=A0A3L6THY7_PANMI|nr:hypothetical protein C2845_PM01G04390 [Panicum miliaceum]
MAVSSSSGSANALACFHASLLAPQTRRTATARINPLFIDGPEIFNGENQKVAEISQVSSPRELELVQPDNVEVKNIVIDFRGGWQVIPAENIVAAFQGCKGIVLAVSTNSTEAQVFLEALEQGLDGVVLKVDDIDDIIKLKVGSYARGMFLVHSECLETNYIASRPFRVNAGPVHAYVTVPGGKTSYLSELRSGKEVIVIDQHGLWRTAIDNSGDDTYIIFLQKAETVALITDDTGSSGRTAIPVTSLKVGDEILVRKQGGARHTGIEIQEFIVEK